MCWHGKMKSWPTSSSTQIVNKVIICTNMGPARNRSSIFLPWTCFASVTCLLRLPVHVLGAAAVCRKSLFNWLNMWIFKKQQFSAQLCVDGRSVPGGAAKLFLLYSAPRAVQHEEAPAPLEGTPCHLLNLIFPHKCGTLSTFRLPKRYLKGPRSVWLLINAALPPPALPFFHVWWCKEALAAIICEGRSTCSAK